MYDLGAKWTAANFEAGFGGDEVSSARVNGLNLVMLSGNIASGLEALGLRQQPLGASAIARGATFSLAMARDRCLAVSLNPLTVREGWHAEGYAATEVSDGYMVVELCGPGLMSVLARATSLDWHASMRSAAISFAGLAAAAVFREDRHRLWLFLDTPNFPNLQRWFAAVTKN